MKRLLRGSTATLVVVLLVVTLGGTAVAAWLIAGSGLGAAQAGAIGPVPTPTAAAAGTTVTVTNFATELTSGAAVAEYTITRRAAASPDTVAATPCSELPATTTPLQCQESDVPAGTWVYRVTAREGAWERSSSDSNQVVVATIVVPTPTVNAVANPTNNTKPLFSGTAGTATGDSPTVTVNVYQGSAASGTPLRTFNVTRSGANWSVANNQWGGNSLVNGTYTVRAEQQGTGGTGYSETRTFIVDTVAPIVTLDTVVTPTLQSRPAFSGTAGAIGLTDTTAADSTTVTVKVYSGSAVGAVPARTLTTTRSGTSWAISQSDWTAAGLAALPDGTYTAQAEQTDGANVGVSAARTFVVDTTAPAVTMTVPAASSFTNDQTPTFSGGAGNATGDVSAVRLTVRNAANTAVINDQLTSRPTATTWSFTPSANLPAGEYSASVTQQDAAGNAGSSAVISFTIDITGPTVAAIGQTSTNNANGIIANGEGLTFTFSEPLNPTSVPATTTLTFTRPNDTTTAATLNIAGVTNGAVSTGTVGWVDRRASVVWNGDLALSNNNTVVTVTITGCSNGCGNSITGGNGSFAMVPGTGLKDRAGNAATGNLSKTMTLF